MVESKIKEIVLHYGVYSKTAQSDMTLCYKKGLEQKEQYAKEQQLKLLTKLKLEILFDCKNLKSEDERDCYKAFLYKIDREMKELQVKQ